MACHRHPVWVAGTTAYRRIVAGAQFQFDKEDEILEAFLVPEEEVLRRHPLQQHKINNMQKRRLPEIMGVAFLIGGMPHFSVDNIKTTCVFAIIKLYRSEDIRLVRVEAANLHSSQT